MTRLRAFYETQVVPKLQAELGVGNRLAVPRLTKAVVNVGMGRVIKDPAVRDTVVSTLARITGQQPVLTRARKSIASFKVRQGMVIGALVTLRGQRLEEFVDKLIHVTLPRVRDFRGIDPRSVADTSLTIGLAEHTVFPEIQSDEVEKLHGLEVTLVSSAESRDQALALFRALGFPFHVRLAQERALDRAARARATGRSAR